VRWRWLVVLGAAVLLVVLPVSVQHRPGGGPPTRPTAELLARIQASGTVGWSGRAESTGTLQLPANDSFATLGQLLGERVELRAWWDGPTRWRVDRVRSTGETDTFRDGDGQVRWIFESERATYSPVSTIRLPDAVDVLPPTLGRDLFQGATVDELGALAGRRVAGVDAIGFSLRPSDAASTVGRVEAWFEPTTWLPVRLDLYARDGVRPVLSTTLTALTLGVPDPADVRFDPPASVALAYEESTDVAAAANALQLVDLPASLAGLPTRDGQDPRGVGVYGRGPTTMIVFPLRGSVARPLREQLERGGGRTDADGTTSPVGPVSILLTRFGARGGGFLLAGTVTPETLVRAAGQLEVRP
jgi:outer membrane lipoprotein-sorting protein